MSTEASFFQLFKIIAVMGNVGTCQTIEEVLISPGETDLILESKGLKHEGEEDIKSLVCLSFIMGKLVASSYTLTTSKGGVCMEGTLNTSASDQDIKNIQAALDGFKKRAKRVNHF